MRLAVYSKYWVVVYMKIYVHSLEESKWCTRFEQITTISFIVPEGKSLKVANEGIFQQHCCHPQRF